MIAIPKQQYKIEFLFPIAILGLSIYTLVYMLPPANVSQGLSTAVAVIGILGAVFYFMNNKLFVPLIFIWSLAQLLIIEYKAIDPETGYKVTKSIFDLRQGITVNAGFTLGVGSKSVYIGINFVSIIFLG